MASSAFFKRHPGEHDRVAAPNSSGPLTNGSAPEIVSYGNKTGEVRILSPAPAMMTVGTGASRLFMKAPRPPQ
jgi:hypothetical protein